MSSTNWPTTATTLPLEITRDVDAYAERLRQEEPGVRVTRSHALRMLVIRGLQAERARKPF